MTQRILSAMLPVMAALTAGWLLAACGAFKNLEDETKGWSAQKLYAEAQIGRAHV